MKNLSGFTDDYDEYIQRERKTVAAMPAAKRLYVDYAEELQKDIIPNTILFYSNNGYGLGGIPKIVLSRIMNDSAFKKYKCIVCLRNKEMIKQMKSAGFRSRRIQYEDLGVNLGLNFFRLLARTQYLIVDGVLPTCYVPRKDQTYIQASFLYSGLVQGYQREMRYTIRSLDYVKNFLAADYIISPSDLYTKEILQDSYYVNHAYQGKVLTCQSPVIEQLNQMTVETARKETGAKRLGDGRKEVLVIGSEQNNGIDIAQILLEMSKKPEYSEYEFYYKPPQVGYRAAREWMNANPAERVNLILNQADILPWMKRCDVILSDYNACLFYAVYLEKPTILLDVAQRREIQCDYMKEHMAALPLVSTARELAEILSSVQAADKSSLGELFDAEMSSDVILDVLQGREVEGKSLQSDVEKVCIVASMGHSTKDTLVAWKSQLNILLKQLLGENKDVTLYTNELEAEENLTIIEQVVPKGVRVIYRFAERVMSEQEILDSSYLIRNFSFCDDIREALDEMDMELNIRELKRSMGNISFDTAIYAGPFSGKFVMLMNAMDAKKKYYWDQRNYPVLLNVEDRPEKNQLRFENLCRVPELFDAVLHWDETERDVVRENHLYTDWDKHHLIQDMLQYHELLEHKPYDVVSLRGQDYWLVSSKKYLDEQRDMQLLIKHKDREHRKALHINYAEHENFEDILKKIQKLHEKNPEDVFYLFEDFQTCRKELGLLLINMAMQDYVILCSKFFLWDVLKEFSVYYSTAKTGDIYEKVCGEYGTAYEVL